MGSRGPAPRKGAPTTLRLEPATREALQEAANKSGRSLSREIEERLVDSLAASGAEGEGAKRETEALLWGLRLVIDQAEQWTGQSWHADGCTRDTVAEAIGLFVRRLGPDVDGALPPPTFPAFMPDLPSQAESKRSIAAQLAPGLATTCAGGVLRAMQTDLSEHGPEIERLWSMERILNSRLGKLIRPANEVSGDAD